VACDEAGELVVLLHDFPEFWRGWRDEIDALADAGYRVAPPELRRCSKSGEAEGVHADHVDELRDDEEAIIHHYNKDRSIVIGHDWGGAVGWHLVSTLPEIVEKFIAINIPHPVVMTEVMKRHPKQMFKSLYMLFFQMPGVPEKLLSFNNYR